MQPLPEQTDVTGKYTRWQGLQKMFLHALWLLLAVVILFFISRVVRPAPCWGLFLLVSLVCWPIWRYRIEYLLFRRRLVLDGVTQSASLARRVLWKGKLTKVLQVVVSLCLAWLLLMLVFQLSLQHWWVLAADSVFLALVYIPVTRGLAGTISTQHLGAVARRWPLFFLNGLVLTAAFMLLDFAVVGAPDTRQLAWNTLAEQTYLTHYSHAGCVLWGVSAGSAAVIEALAWHGSQLVIPNLPDMSTKIIVWTFFLLRAATVAWLFTAMLLGVSVMLERRALQQDGHKSGSTLSRAFIITILLLALPFFYAVVVLDELDPADFEYDGQDASVLLEPCKQDTGQREQLHAKLDSDVETKRQQAIQTIDERVSEELDVLFTDIEQGVDRYLDWYFTVIGEYQRLAAVFTADVAQTMREQLEKHLFADSDFDVQLGMLDGDLEQMTTERFAQLAPQLRQELAGANCNIGQLSLTSLSELDHDTLRASVAATSGIGAGIVTSKVLAGKTTAAVVGKVAAKKSFQTGAALATKTLAKKGSSTLLSAGAGAAICAPTGPVAILCGVTAGLITWFTVDKVLVELELETDTRTVLKFYWPDKNGQFSERRMAQLLIKPDKTQYKIRVCNISGIDFLRIDPSEKTAYVTIKKLALQQSGYPPYILKSSADFGNLQVISGVESLVRQEKGGVKVQVKSRDPQLRLLLPPTRHRTLGLYDFGCMFLVMLLAMIGYIVFSSFFKRSDFIPVLSAIVLALILVMAGISQFNAHPDEIVHVAAGKYYENHNLPPQVGSAVAEHTYSVYGVSRLHSGEIVYLLAGKFLQFLRPLHLEPFLALRLFNVLMFTCLVLYAYNKLDFRFFLLPILISPQIWYVFSYFNSDAFATFIGLISAYQLAADKSAFNTMLQGNESKGSWSTLLLLGILFGLLLLLKKNFYFLYMFFFLYFIWRAWLVGPAWTKKTVFRCIGN